MSSAFAPCCFANFNTFCPASSGLILAPVSPPVRSVAINRTANTIVEIVQ